MTRILVTYASKHGSTAEIAEAIGEELRAAGLLVDCVEVDRVRSLDGYDAVVLGSAISMKRWRREARHFLRAHGTELARLPFWAFSSGPVGDPAEAPDGTPWSEPAHTIQAAERLGVRDHVVFGGSLAADVHGFPASAMARNMPTEFLDRRDWAEIRSWAASIAGAIVGDRAVNASPPSSD